MTESVLACSSIKTSSMPISFRSAFIGARPAKRPITSNHAMERTADRSARHISDDFHPSTPSDARSRPPSLILFSLDAEAHWSLADRRITAFGRCVSDGSVGPIRSLSGCFAASEPATEELVLRAHRRCHSDRSGTRGSRHPKPAGRLRASSCIYDRPLARERLRSRVRVDQHFWHMNASNQAMQRTAGRSAITLSMIPTPPVFATRALARGR